ncbi:hypothetical protein VUR80DRAFT_1794 [Thermomyces stellatus]
MGKASIKAKEKLEAVLNNPNRNDNSGIKDRYMSTRAPSTGAGGVTNRVERRQSQVSWGSRDGVPGGKIKNFVRSMWGPPAY